MQLHVASEVGYSREFGAGISVTVRAGPFGARTCVRRERVAFNPPQGWLLIEVLCRGFEVESRGGAQGGGDWRSGCSARL